MRINLKSTCLYCGLTLEMKGDDSVKVLTALDGAHDLLRPLCSAPKATKASK